MYIKLKGLELDHVKNILNHLKRQKKNVLNTTGSDGALEELRQVEYILENINISTPDFIEVYSVTWAKYTSQSLKEGVTTLSNYEYMVHLKLQTAENSIIDNAGNVVKSGDSVFVYFYEDGMIKTNVTRFTNKGVIVINSAGEEKFLLKEHGYRLHKV